MLVSFGLIALVVAVEGWPVGRMLRLAHAGMPGGMPLAGVAIALGWAITVPVFLVARRAGLRAWSRLGE